MDRVRRRPSLILESFNERLLRHTSVCSHWAGAPHLEICEGVGLALLEDDAEAAGPVGPGIDVRHREHSPADVHLEVQGELVRVRADGWGYTHGDALLNLASNRRMYIRSRPSYFFTVFFALTHCMCLFALRFVSVLWEGTRCIVPFASARVRRCQGGTFFTVDYPCSERNTRNNHLVLHVEPLRRRSSSPKASESCLL